jgi:hypothetical protein
VAQAVPTMYQDPSMRPAFGTPSPSELRRLGGLAGVLMIVGGLASIPAELVLEPPPQVHEHLLGLGTALLGVVALSAPWERMSPNWLHLAMIVGTLEIASGVAVFSDDFAFFYVLGAMFAAYVIRDRSVLIAYMLFFTLTLVAPLVYSNESLKEQAHHILVTFPVMVISAVTVRYLRDTLEQRERDYRGFASEAVSLAERIRGRPAVPEGEADDLETRLDRLAAAER